jgi:hypothetical protein
LKTAEHEQERPHWIEKKRVPKLAVGNCNEASRQSATWTGYAENDSAQTRFRQKNVRRVARQCQAESSVVLWREQERTHDRSRGQRQYPQMFRPASVLAFGVHSVRIQDKPEELSSTTRQVRVFVDMFKKAAHDLAEEADILV